MEMCMYGEIWSSAKINTNLQVKKKRENYLRKRIKKRKID
jgi:hypothetical protein